MTHSSSKFENMAMNSGQFYATTELLYCEFQTFFLIFSSHFSRLIKLSKLTNYSLDYFSNEFKPIFGQSKSLSKLF